MTPPPDEMPAAVLIVRPDGSAVYVALREYQAALAPTLPAPVATPGVRPARGPGRQGELFSSDRGMTP